MNARPVRVELDPSVNPTWHSHPRSMAAAFRDDTYRNPIELPNGVRTVLPDAPRGEGRAEPLLKRLHAAALGWLGGRGKP